MTNALSEQNLHEGRGKSCSGRCGHRLASRKSCHATGSNKVSVTPFKVEMGSSIEGVNVEYQERCFNWELVNEFRNFHVWVSKGAARALRTFLLAIAIHPRPVIPEAQFSMSAVGIQVATNEVSMEANKESIPQ